MSVEHDTPTSSGAQLIEGFSSHTTAPDDALDMFAAARSRCPVAHSKEHNGFYLLLGHEEVRRAAGDHQTYSSEPQVLRPILERPSLAALEMDPPQHGDWRHLFDQAVTPHVVSYLEPLVRADVRRHINSFIEEGSADLVKELAEPIPAEAICRLVGIDDDLVLEVRDRAIAMFAAQGDPEQFAQRVAEFADVAVGEVRRRQKEPRDDYLTYLAGVEIGGRPLEDDGFIAVLTGFLGAGHHTTTSAMSSLIYHVFGAEGVRDAVAADPSRVVPIAVEESLRLRPPFFGFFRRATADSVVGEVAIPAGSDVYLGWAAANRDPEVFSDPNEFRLDRGRNRHLSFGAGLHTCPGAPLARLELRIVIEELLRRTPDLRVEISEPAYAFSGGDYAHMRELPVSFTPGSREEG